MTWKIRAHFDGKVIVPDESVDLPVDSPLEVSLSALPGNGAQAGEQVIQERLRRLARATGCLSAPTIPAEALRRESLYE